MSMIMNLRTASDARLKELLSKPESIRELLASKDDPRSDCMDLDKTWHAIHYLLCGSAWEGDWPEAFLLTGGEPIGDVDVGYGPARGLTAEETSEVAAALESVPVKVLAARYDGAKLDAAEIYPEIWARDGEEGLDYITEYYETLRYFVAAAAKRKLGMLIYTN